jgi:hypothetical protein
MTAEKIPIRMRGYWRAVHSKEDWALRIHRLGVGSLPWLLAICYRNVDFKELVYANNPFLALVNKEESFPGKYLPVPIKFS